MVKVLVCGGRKYSRRSFLHRVLKKLHKKHKFSFVVTGGQTGADTLAYNWAIENNIPAEKEMADWDAFGLGGGSKRNINMLVKYKPDLVIVFPGNDGTKNMEFTSKLRRIPTIGRHDNDDELKELLT